MTFSVCIHLFFIFLPLNLYFTFSFYQLNHKQSMIKWDKDISFSALCLISPIFQTFLSLFWAYQQAYLYSCLAVMILRGIDSIFSLHMPCFFNFIISFYTIWGIAADESLPMPHKRISRVNQH